MLSIDILNASNQLLHQQVLSAAQSLHLDIILLNPNISTSIIRIAGKRKDLEVIELILNAIFSQQIGCKVEPLSQTSLSHQVIPADNWSAHFTSFVKLTEFANVSVSLNKYPIFYLAYV